MSSLNAQPFDGLTGQIGNQLVVTVEMKDRELCELAGRCDEKIGDGRGTVLTSISQRSLHRDGTVLDRGR